MVDGKLAGFVLVNDYPEVEGRKTDFCLPNFLYYINIAETVSDVRRFVRFWTDIMENGS